MPFAQEATSFDDDSVLDHLAEYLPLLPFIHDPGNGPRIRDTRAFLTSKFFAHPPALDVSVISTAFHDCPHVI